MKINLKYSTEMDQVIYLQGYHRSGWNYVVNSLLKYQDPNGIQCDTYVDRTFHWLKPSFLPYKKDWVGFIHHTFDTSFSRYNNERLLKNKLFIESLKCCQGLFVFSKNDQKRFQKEFGKRNINVKVEYLVHPTETVEPPFQFTLDKFFNNETKRLIQIGAWLRNNYSIFRLNNGKQDLKISKTDNLKKCALIGKNMENYYKPLDFFTRFELHKYTNEKVKDSTGNDSSALFSIKQPNVLYSLTGQRLIYKSTSLESKLSVNGFYPFEFKKPITSPCSEEEEDGICRDNGICRDVGISRTDPLSTRNKYTLGAINMLKEYDDSVTLIYQVDNQTFDNLLSENIVFLNLVDAAAVNTVLECIVRNTPIIVNKLDAIVDILGENYPLYYSTLEEVESFTIQDIISGHLYLSKLNKYPLTINYFLNRVMNSQIMR
jgi:hypothetical protein